MAKGGAIGVLRWLPFCVVALVSLWVASGLPNARKPFVVDFDLSVSSISASVAKVKHYEATALFVLLGVVAVGLGRVRVAFWLAMGLGVAWELAEATGVRHTARVADLLPDVIAAVGSAVLVLGARLVLEHWRGRQTENRVG